MRCASDPYSLRALLDELVWVPGPVAFDLEWVRPKGYEGTPLNHADVFVGSIAYRQEVESEPTGWLLHGNALPGMKEWFEDPYAVKVGHGIIHADSHVLTNHGITLRGVGMDTLIASRLLNPSSTYGHALKPDWAERVGWKNSVKWKQVVSRPGHSAKPSHTYAKTHTSKRKHCPACPSQVKKELIGYYCKVCDWAGDGPRLVNYHYTKGAETYNVSWSTREEIPLPELWQLYPERRKQLTEYAIQDAVLHLLVAEEITRRLEDIKW